MSFSIPSVARKHFFKKYLHIFPGALIGFWIVGDAFNMIKITFFIIASFYR